ncbi:spore germination protein [Neobacillus mesonae]|uniref:spore germination protein n=1 Tax=Neobacillus mesonae TaxID=1193713 RepID=UPI00203E4ED8|nr:spore germination protein [Neobacillus mesonae]MCM3569769.1 spore germination protein [Neobacillus mesonae]
MIKKDSLSIDLAENIKVLESIYADCSDVIFRHFSIGNRIKAILIYIEGMSDMEEMDKNVLTPLMLREIGRQFDIQTILEKNLAVSAVKEVSTFKDVTNEVSSGNPVVLINHQSQGVSVGFAKSEKRSIQEPTSESVVRGPRDGFIETLSTNIVLLRQKIKSTDLKTKSIQIGRYSQTKVVIMYIEGLADHALIQEVENRLNRIDIDGVLESGYIEEFIKDHPYSPFPQILNTERPDVTAASLLEGNVVILTDGTPFVLIAPTTFYSLLQSAEDYYGGFIIGTFLRWLRYAFLLVALLLPSVYVAILTYHQEMVPTSLLISVAKSREQIPFPALVEALLMEGSFEALREAGIRLPKNIGSAISIVGALVIGQAAVSAGLVSAPMVMVVAITGIASFMIPRYSAAITLRILRFPIMFLAGTLGLVGIMLGILTIIVHMCTIRSFGVPYLQPLAPIRNTELKDSIIRAPWWSLKNRPHWTSDYNKVRQPNGQKPSPSKGKE